MITDNKTRRSKGIAYVEFADVASVSLALGLNGQKLLGVPIIVQPSQAEKNRTAGQATMSLLRGQNVGPMRLYVGSLHFNITEEMLRGIFEPFGRVSLIFNNYRSCCPHLNLPFPISPLLSRLLFCHPLTLRPSSLTSLLPPPLILLSVCI